MRPEVPPAPKGKTVSLVVTGSGSGIEAMPGIPADPLVPEDSAEEECNKCISWSEIKLLYWEIPGQTARKLGFRVVSSIDNLWERVELGYTNPGDARCNVLRVGEEYENFNYDQLCAEDKTKPWIQVLKADIGTKMVNRDQPTRFVVTCSKFSSNIVVQCSCNTKLYYKHHI